MYTLPTSVKTKDGNTYHIVNNGDYRVVLECFKACNDSELSEDEKALACLLIFYDNIDNYDDLRPLSSNDLNDLITFMFDFFNCGQKSIGANKNRKLIDWEQDEQMIVSAINNVAHTEVRALEYLHWWTFMGYYLSVGESVLSTVVSIRDKTARGKKLEKYEKEFKQNNPEYFMIKQEMTKEEKEFDDYIMSMWNSGKGD